MNYKLEIYSFLNIIPYLSEFFCVKNNGNIHDDVKFTIISSFGGKSNIK